MEEEEEDKIPCDLCNKINCDCDEQYEELVDRELTI